MIRPTLWLALLVSILLTGVFEWPRAVLFVNTRALTMNPAQPFAEALLIKGQQIVAVGDSDRLRQMSPDGTRVIDLDGQAILPGFVDAHSHFPSSGLSQAGLDLTPPPTGRVDTLAELLTAVASATHEKPSGQWIIGFNYDDASLPEARHPGRFELDAVAPRHPVYLRHRSGHMGVGNSLALKALGYRDLPADQPGNTPAATQLTNVGHSFPGDVQPAVRDAHLGRDSQGRLTGLLQEHAAPGMATLLKHLPKSRLLHTLFSARDEYLKAGITTVQNGYADMATMQLLRWGRLLRLFPQRVLVWPAHDKVAERLKLSATTEPLHIDSQADTSRMAADLLANALAWPGLNPENMALSAIKLVADGSPQGRTAWLGKPYLVDERDPLGTTAAYRGFPQMPEARFKALVKRYHTAGLQLAVHGNGDASIDLFIEAIREAQAAMFRTDARHMLVHAQTIRADQLEQLALLGVGVSFFPSHTYFWGDWYRTRVLGEDRAQLISPLATADLHSVRYTLHTDAPVTPMNPMQVLWSATKRQTLTGEVLGPELVISRERALRAMTLDAAWQNHLDADRGSLEVGKLADIVVLSGDPLRVDDVRTLQVQQVWIGGRRVYHKSD